MPNETSTKKRLSPTVYYLLTGIALSWPCLWMSGQLAPQWMHGAGDTPISLALIHLMVLGFMLTVGFGVLYQLIPIAFQAPPVGRHVLFWHLPIHVLSVAAMVWGFLSLQYSWVGMGGTLLLVNAVAFLTFVFRSYRKARNKTIVHRALVVPMASLGLVMGVGLYQAYLPSRITSQTLMLHVLFGGLGFWGGLVLVFTYKLLPMFAISHGYTISLKRSGLLYFNGVLAWIVSAFTHSNMALALTVLSGVLLLAGLGSFVKDIVSIIRYRKRNRFVMPLYDAFVSTIFYVMGQAGLVVSAATPNHFWLYPSAFLFGFGGLGGMIFSYAQKIVPFLWFEYRFSKRPERKTAPLIDEMVPSKWSQPAMAAYFLGMLFDLCGGMVFPSSSAAASITAWTSSILMTMGSLLLWASLAQVLTIGGRRPADS